MTNDSLVDSIKQNILSSRQTWPVLSFAKFNPTSDRTSPIPAHTNIKRILGSETPDGIDLEFLRSGELDLQCALSIANVYGFKGGKVVEWGVGCGRMSRHLNTNLRAEFLGVDVDTVNINWCKQNLLWGTYEPIDKFGRIPLADKTADLIYGWSVMTHLSEESQNWWLKELNRVCRGIVILSVHGFLHSASSADWWNDPTEVASWIQSGYRDSETPNLDIADVVGGKYYRDVAHTPKYITENWSKFINVFDIIPGGFGGVHDAVVCYSK